MAAPSSTWSTTWRQIITEHSMLLFVQDGKVWTILLWRTSRASEGNARYLYFFQTNSSVLILKLLHRCSWILPTERAIWLVVFLIFSVCCCRNGLGNSKLHIKMPMGFGRGKVGSSLCCKCILTHHGLVV